MSMTLLQLLPVSQLSAAPPTVHIQRGFALLEAFQYPGFVLDSPLRCPQHRANLRTWNANDTVRITHYEVTGLHSHIRE